MTKTIKKGGHYGNKLYENHRSEKWVTLQKDKVEAYDVPYGVLHGIERSIHKSIEQKNEKMTSIHWPKIEAFMKNLVKELSKALTQTQYTDEIFAENIARKELPLFKNFWEAMEHATKGVIKRILPTGVVVFLGTIESRDEKELDEETKRRNGEVISVYLPQKVNKNVMVEDIIDIQTKIAPRDFINRKKVKELWIVLNETEISYQQADSDKKITGKVIWFGIDDMREEVIFKPTHGPIFSIKASTLERGIRRAESKKEIIETIQDAPKANNTPANTKGKQFISKYLKTVDNKKVLDREQVKTDVKTKEKVAEKKVEPKIIETKPKIIETKPKIIETKPKIIETKPVAPKKENKTAEKKRIAYDGSIKTDNIIFDGRKTNGRDGKTASMQYTPKKTAKKEEPKQEIQEAKPAIDVTAIKKSMTDKIMAKKKNMPKPTIEAVKKEDNQAPLKTVEVKKEELEKLEKSE